MYPYVVTIPFNPHRDETLLVRDPYQDLIWTAKVDTNNGHWVFCVWPLTISRKLSVSVEIKATMTGRMVASEDLKIIDSDNPNFVVFLKYDSWQDDKYTVMVTVTETETALAQTPKEKSSAGRVQRYHKFLVKSFPEEPFKQGDNHPRPGSESSQKLKQRCNNVLWLFLDEPFKQDDLTDCVIECQEEKFHAHRNVLGNISTVFRNAFKAEGMKECETSCITIDQFEPKAMIAFLTSLYDQNHFQQYRDDIL